MDLGEAVLLGLVEALEIIVTPNLVETTFNLPAYPQATY